MKILNVLYDNIIFLLRDINCHTRIQSMLKSFEKASSSKKTFQNFRPYGLGHIKIELTNQDKRKWSQLFIKILGVHFVRQKQLRH